MSIRHASDTSNPLRTSSDGSWVRPSDWPALPWIADATQGFVGLIAVYDTGSEHLSLLCAGNYTVDWGDGTAPENVSTGVKASHTYNYSTLASSVTSRGYKTAVVAITANGGNLTQIDLNQKHALSGSGVVCSPWLDLQINAVNLTVLKVSYSAVQAKMLEALNIRRHALTNINDMCTNCYALRAINNFGTQSITTATNAFNACRSMVEYPPFDWSALVSMGSMFINNFSLKKITTTNFPNVTDAQNTYQNCYSIEEIPRMSFPKLTQAMLMFAYMYGLKRVKPLYFLVLGNCSRMFEGDYALEEVALFYTGSASNVSSLFYSCATLRRIPAFDFHSATAATGVLEGCHSLVDAPVFTFGAAASVTNLVAYTQSLKEIPAWDLSTATTVGTLAIGAVSLARSRVTGVKVTHSYASLNLSAAALNEIFTNLASGVTGQTITVTGNPGAATCTPSIATAKGWTVVT